MEKRNSELTGFVVSSFRLRHIVHSYPVPIHHAPWGFSCIHNCCWLKYCTSWKIPRNKPVLQGRLYWHVYTKQILSISTWCMVVSPSCASRRFCWLSNSWKVGSGPWSTPMLQHLGGFFFWWVKHAFFSKKFNTFSFLYKDWVDHIPHYPCMVYSATFGWFWW